MAEDLPALPSVFTPIIALREGGDSGLPFMISAPDAPAAVAIQALAERLHGMRTQDPLARIKKPLKIV